MTVIIFLLLTLTGCVAPKGFVDCQVRAVALWYQPGYGNRFDRERAIALQAQSDRAWPDKEKLYRYLEKATCQ